VAAEARRDSDTAIRVLEIGERLVQTRGYNGFSYADIATELGVTKASLHYHFPSKGDLGEALIARYAERFAAALDDIEGAGLLARAELDAYVALYRGVLQNDRMCLCGILAGEHQTLPQPMRDALIRFFNANETWLVALLDRGRLDGSIAVQGPSVDTARLVLSSLEGAMLVARANGDVSRFDSTARSLVSSLCSAER
jgi:TetR/AcrR family transcriptional repressor of nem operon